MARLHRAYAYLAHWSTRTHTMQCSRTRESSGLALACHLTSRSLTTSATLHAKHVLGFSPMKRRLRARSACRSQHATTALASVEQCWPSVMALLGQAPWGPGSVRGNRLAVNHRPTGMNPVVACQADTRPLFRRWNIEQDVLLGTNSHDIWMASCTQASFCWLTSWDSMCIVMHDLKPKRFGLQHLGTRCKSVAVPPL